MMGDKATLERASEQLELWLVFGRSNGRGPGWGYICVTSVTRQSSLLSDRQIWVGGCKQDHLEEPRLGSKGTQGADSG